MCHRRLEPQHIGKLQICSNKDETEVQYAFNGITTLMVKKIINLRAI